jgi:hypothetical protein
MILHPKTATSHEILQLKIKVPEGQQGIKYLTNIFSVFNIVSRTCDIGKGLNSRLHWQLDEIPRETLESGIYTTMTGMVCYNALNPKILLTLAIARVSEEDCSDSGRGLADA